MKPVRIIVYDRWSSELDAVLDALPPSTSCPQELYRALLTAPTAAQRRFVVWYRDTVPAGLLGLVRRNFSTLWEPVTQWIVPGFLAAGEPSMIADLCLSLRMPIRFAWWRIPWIPKVGGNVRRINAESTHRLRCTEFENYWSQTGVLKRLEAAEKRCRRFRVGINEPGAAKWVISGSEAFWRAPGEPMAENLPRQLLAAEWLARHGRGVTVSLHDGDALVAGEVGIIHEGTLVSTHTFRNRSHSSRGVGNVVLAAFARWARDTGLNEFDLGGGFEYKHEWAPPSGVKARVIVCTSAQFLQYRAQKQLLLPMINTARRLVQRYAGTSPRREAVEPGNAH